MAKIFLSYRREDSIGVAGRIYDRLHAHFGPDSIFRDIDNIPFGVDFREYIDAAVGQCDLVLAVIGPKWAGESDAHRRIDDPRDFVRIEVESALKRNIPVIPILIDKSYRDAPTASDLPPSLTGLTYRNAIDVDQGRDFHPHVDRLIRGIEFHFERKKPAPASPSGQPQEQNAERPVPKGAGQPLTASPYTADPPSKPTPGVETQPGRAPSASSPVTPQTHSSAPSKGFFRTLFGAIWGKAPSISMRLIKALLFLVVFFVGMIVIHGLNTLPFFRGDAPFVVVGIVAFFSFWIGLIGFFYQSVCIVYSLVKRLPTR